MHSMDRCCVLQNLFVQSTDQTLAPTHQETAPDVTGEKMYTLEEYSLDHFRYSVIVTTQSAKRNKATHDYMQ